MNLAALLAALDHPGARRRFVAARLDGEVGRGAAADALEDPVAGLGIPELTGTMTFHSRAVALVDLATSLCLAAGVGIALDAAHVRVGDGGQVTVDPDSRLGPADAEAVADALVAALDPVIAAVEPVDEVLRWGAVADLVTVIALARSRAHQLDPEETWAQAAELVEALRDRRPHPPARPEALAVPGPDGTTLVLARRSTCCQWYRAARQLAEGTGAEPSVTDARCADCPALDPAANVARLTALAAAGDLADP